MASATTADSAAIHPYDEAPYPAVSHPSSHPNRLAAMARLFGVAAVDPSKARVLELGCADGANLLPMADHYPGSRFLGLDASKIQIAEAQKAIDASGLKNVEVRHQDLLSFKASEGQFDYIIVHGLLSWVSAPVQEKIFAICRDHLSERGVAYVSYNALPGWNMRRSLRDMMLYHTKDIAGSKGKVLQARALLAFLSESVPTENNAYGILLKAELEMLRGAADNYLRHEYLEEDNTAFYFHEFISHAERHGLQFLGEPGIAQMLASNFSDQVRDTLEQLSGQIVRQEQYMDFIRNRVFRQTLLCRKGVSVNRSISPAVLPNFAFRSLFRALEAAVDLTPGVVASFPAVTGFTLNTSDAFVKALLQILAESNGVCAISYRDLLDMARLRSRPVMGAVLQDRDKVDEETLSANLLSLLAKGVVELYAEPVSVSVRVPEKPLVTPLLRYQAANARFITNRVHHPVPADVVGRYVIEFSDGSRTRDEILGALITYVKQDKLAVKEGEQRITDIQRLRVFLGPQVDQILNRIAASGLFVS
jgi:methyltransferase-like protein/trans-aconitate methyltransferase